MNVLIVDRYSKEMAKRLETELGCKTTWAATLQPTAAELTNQDIVMIRSRTIIDEKFFAIAPNVKLVVSATAGFDHVKIKSIPAIVKVVHTPEANTRSAAELTLLFLLALSRQYSTVTDTVRKKNWRDSIGPAHELAGQHLGLLGFGRVGQMVAKMAKPFGLHIAAFDPYQNEAIFKDLGVERLGLTELFVQSDFLSLHTPLTKETHHIIRRSTIELMPDHVSIINTSRGAVISECELIQALEQGEVAAAALDVFETEPLAKDSNIFRLPNVIMTPHVGAYTEEALKAGSEMAFRRVEEFLSNKKSEFSVPPPTEWAQHLG
jgi:D-3-phosphoglycerate dehydrogenase